MTLRKENKKLTLKALMLMALFCITTVTHAQFLSAPAFPGAEGFGRYTTGGRGGQVIHVTNLNDSGTGSLRAAINTSGKRIIVFDVAGVIELASDLKITNDNCTILGQTAPGGGICLRNYTLHINANNVIVRYIRCRMGDTAKNENDAMSASHGTGSEKRNIIIDHCSISWCVDECGSFYGNEDFTLQWCILSESLRNSVHDKGNHGYGGIWGGSNAAFHHNLLAHHDSRNPRFDHGYVSELAGIVDYVNNVVYNWGGNTTYGGENKPGLDPKKFNMINNYYKPGPYTTNVSGKANRLLNPTTQCSNCNSSDKTDVVPGKFYINGNYVNGSTVSLTTSSTSSSFIAFDSNYNFSSFISNCILNERQLSQDNDFGSYNTISLHTASDAFRKTVAYAGASLSRDAVDTRIASETTNGTYTCDGSNGSTYGLIDTQSDVGGWPTYTGTAATDSDGDGIPDEWETAHGLNNSTDNSATYNLDKYGFYTDLEVYANYLVQDITKAERADATASFDEYYPLDENAITPISTTQASAPYITANSSGKVTITCLESDATIYYTTDNSTPTTSSKCYTGAFTVGEPCTVKAIAVVSGKENSEVTSYEVTSYGVANAYIVDTADPAANAEITSVDGITMTYGACTDWTANTANITIDGVTFPYYAAASSSNGTNSTTLATSKPTSNSYWVFTPTKDGTLTLAVCNVGTGKAMCIVEDGTMIGATLVDVDGTTSSSLTSTTLSAGGTLPSSSSWSGGIQFEVKAGSTYTYSLSGSKGRLCGFIFDDGEEEQEEETVWDFSEYTTQVTAADDNYTTTYRGLTLVGNSTSGYTKDIYSATAGFKMNGTSSSTTRHIKYTPTSNGVWTIYYRSNNADATDRITAIGTQVTTGTSLTAGTNGVLAYGYTSGSTVKTIQAELTAGTTYYAYFANGGQAITKLVFTPGATIADTPSTLALIDGEDYTQTSDIVYESVTFSKEISESLANKWTSLYVPFAINVSDYSNVFDIAEISTFSPYYDTNNDGVIDENDDDMLVVTKISSGTTEPNIPYLIRAKAAGTIVITPVNNKTYAATSGKKVCETSSATYTFTGLNGSINATESNNYYYMSEGTLSHRTSGSTTILANRWYMTVNNSTSAKASFGIAVIGEEDQTAVAKIKANDSNASDAIHSVSGVRMNGNKSLPAGIYIQNNKKYIVK